MTKNDYIAIAKILKTNTDPTGKIHLGMLLNDLCQVFAADNPSFSEAKFRKACQ